MRLISRLFGAMEEIMSEREQNGQSNFVKTPDGQYEKPSQNRLGKCSCDDYTKTGLGQLFHPLFKSMYLLGLYFKRDYQIAEDNNSKGEKIPWRRKFTLSMGYSFLSLVMMTLNLLRSVGVFFYLDDHLSNVVYGGWALLCIMNALSCFMGCLRYNAIPEFFLLWETACPIMRSDCCKKLRKLNIIVTSGCWIVTTLNTGFCAYMILETSTFDHLLYPFQDDHLKSIPMKIIAIVITFFYSAAWIFPVGLLYLVCHVLTAEFKFLSNEIKEDLTRENCLQKNVENSRWKHTRFTTMVGHANDFLMYHLAASCLINMVNN